VDIKQIHSICAGIGLNRKRSYYVDDINRINIVHFCGWQIKLESNNYEHKKAHEIVPMLKERYNLTDECIASDTTERMFEIQGYYDSAKEAINLWIEGIYNLPSREDLRMKTQEERDFIIS